MYENSSFWIRKQNSCQFFIPQLKTQLPNSHNECLTFRFINNAAQRQSRLHFLQLQHKNVGIDFKVTFQAKSYMKKLK